MGFCTPLPRGERQWIQKKKGKKKKFYYPVSTYATDGPFRTACSAYLEALSTFLGSDIRRKGAPITGMAVLGICFTAHGPIMSMGFNDTGLTA